MPLQTNQVLLNKYRIERLIGEGGFGYVYEATDLNLNRRVAIKELKTELASNPEMLGRFVSEARAVANLNDPHIVQVLDYHKEADHHYIIMEYMDGGSLAGLLSKRGSLTPGEAALIAKAISDGLATVHRQGIVHRDLKPSNILLARDGQIVKISDFGIAHVPQSVSGIGNLTRIGTAMGTVWYMSPEQARGERVDGRSDIYSLGTILYEMVAGYTYLNFSSDFLRDLDTLKTTPPRPLPAAVPQGLQRIISKAIAIDPAQRYQKAEDLSADLQAFVTPGATIAVPRTDPGSRIPPPISPVPPRAKPPMPLLAVGALVGVVVLCLLAFVAYKIINPDQPTTRPPVSQPTAIAGVPQPTAPLADLTAVWQGVAATATANARATQVLETVVAARVIASLTAGAPTLTPSPTGMRLAPTSTPTPVPTIPPGSPIKRLDPVMGNTGIEGVNVTDLRTQASVRIYGEVGVVSAAWSPDGTKVLLSSLLTQGNILNRTLRVLDADGKNIRDVHMESCRPPVQKCSVFGPYEAIWSPDGKRFFLREANVLSLRNSDGSPSAALASSPARLETVPMHYPRFWSTDGKWLVIISYTPPNHTLQALELDGTRRVPVSALSGFQVYDQRYWPWRVITPPSTCASLEYFSCP